MNETDTFLAPYLVHALPWLYAESYYWTVIGLAGNLLFGSRFLIQWIHSERSGKLLVPPIFWHLSFWGSLISLLYAFHIDKLPIILGYGFLPIIHGRNLFLLRRASTPVPAAQ